VESSIPVAPQWSLTGNHLPKRSFVPTIGDTRHAILVTKSRQLINEWLQTKIHTPPECVITENNTDAKKKKRYAGWVIPGIKVGGNPVVVLEDETLALTLELTVYKFFSSEVKYRTSSTHRQDVASEALDDEVLSAVVMALEFHLGK
jgi:hypothetical protein